MIDVVFYEAFEEEQEVIKRLLPSRIKAQFTPKTIQESGQRHPPAEVISIRTQSRLPKEWEPQVKGILTRSQGYDHLLDVLRATEGKIAGGYLGNYCARAVAEQAILMMLALFRKFKAQIEKFETFTREGLTGKECRGRKVFVVGVGNIGKEIVSIAQALGMRVKGFDIVQKVEGLDYVRLEEGVCWADVIFCALPLNEQTKGMLNYTVFREAVEEPVFVNIARGEVSPLEDLERLLTEGVLGGVGLDVYSQEHALAAALRDSQEKVKAGQRSLIKLAQRENVLFTPHNAFNTKEALERKAFLSVESVVQYFQKGEFLFPILRG